MSPLFCGSNPYPCGNLAYRNRTIHFRFPVYPRAAPLSTLVPIIPEDYACRHSTFAVRYPYIN
ncbi:hypothetical protein HMPREF3293_00328 [Christensenella minuta]|uniref:Uncharacterized protein n=1 Tax=Christensenella minuta TaxID=626937 RepID=A0A136Q812_9FIRM|nr:hypothetical protein HMPREF3293_00328 [Christensenella minuta]